MLGGGAVRLNGCLHGPGRIEKDDNRMAGCEPVFEGGIGAV